ncbi:MAG TPA: Dabb family protein [Streptosporangiaceae bacterium]|jgi:hypothetical protein
MLRHMVLFTWTDDASDEQKRRVAAELGTLPGLIPQIRAYTFGADAGINEGSFDFGVVADFDDTASYLVYRDDPRHRAIIEQHIMPIVARRAAMQFEV